MRVFVAGATGTIGRPLVAALVRRGHDVTGLGRDPARAGTLSSLGATPVTMDVLDRAATIAAVTAAGPDVVVDQLTALPRTYTPEEMRRTLAATNAMRTAGGDNVYAGAVEGGARRYVGQSGCYFYQPGPGLAVEAEPWVQDGPPLVASTVDALRALEERTLGADAPLDGVALRYGFFHGPGTWFHATGDVAMRLFEGHYPIIGSGAGLWSFVSLDDAVNATVTAVESDITGAFNVCAEPVALNDWLTGFARQLGAPPPARLPVAADTDPDALYYAELLRGADSQRARTELGFDPGPLRWD